MESIVDLSEAVFTAIVLIVSAGASAHICFGYGTRKWKHSFIFMVCTLLLSTQMYYLILAAAFVPSHPYVYDNALVRVDCLESSKGGKRPRGASGEEYLNPCFCHANASCIDKNTGIVLNKGSCPIDGSAYCSVNISGHLSEIDLYISARRGCEGGQPSLCTLTNPCYPCSREELPEFGVGRCQMCSTSNARDCKFLPGAGPYCFSEIGSKNFKQESDPLQGMLH